MQKIDEESQATQPGLTASNHLKPTRCSGFLPTKPDATAGLGSGEVEQPYMKLGVSLMGFYQMMVGQDSMVPTSELAFQQLKSTSSMNQTRKPNTIGAANKTSQNYRAGGGACHIALQALYLSTGRKHQIKSNAALVSGVILSSIA